MVNRENVMKKLKNGFFVGMGTFGSTFVGNFLDDQLPGGDIGVGVGQLAVGAGMSVAADEFIDNRSSIPNDVVEFSGYGVQGAAWAELADAVTSGQTSGGVTEVEVSDVSDTGSSPDVDRGGQVREEEDFLADVG